MTVSGQAQATDPLALAEQMPGAAWKNVMKEFRKLDRNDDGLLSPAERGIEGEIHKTYGNLYHVQGHAWESLPQKWTTGVNLVWEDGTMTSAEFWKLLATVRSLRSNERTAAQRSWLLLRRMLRDRDTNESTSSVVDSWAQSDPGSASAWLQNLPDRGR